MKKITNKQTAPSNAVTLNAGEFAIKANAASVAEHDTSVSFGSKVMEFNAIFDALDVAEFRLRRACWVAAYVDAMGCSPVSAANRFAEMVKAANVTKPQSDRALKEVARRSAAKAATDTLISKVAGIPPEDDVKSDVAASAAKAVKMELSSIEAHIVSLMRQGKYVLAAQAVANMAAQATSNAALV